ncbi:MAG: carbohydrate binding family 9 domain-containing protein [Bacteroidales bacterium]|nr:carbohydrate binding family 9 domain-containing protein [Bacteroidales bacterium]
MRSTINIIKTGRPLAILFLLLFSDMNAAAISRAYGAPREKRRATAVRTVEKIAIDGLLNEPTWQNAGPATDFIIYNPQNGVPSSYITEVRVLYDDDALYIGAMMYDDHPDSIFAELGQRDEGDINADHFYVEISPFNDGLNGEVFKVSASNVQIDNKLSTTDSWGHNDDTWDAVWESRTGITDNGWIAEIRIPYSALRFAKSATQVWGINFWREVRRTRETSSWNFVTKEFGSTIAHLGELTGIRDVEPPLRLSLVPYVSGYLEHVSDQPGVGTSYNGGLDLKVGLSESFTLDATLIPDFGQVQSDDQVLNLTPYEVKYNEKRPFFMEGTELFNKGDIFYSRRIGGTPHLVRDVYEMTDEGETVTKNPAEVSLLNATKISGRTKGGLGIGMFNAVTNSMWATVENTVTGDSRRIRTEPLTNYNMLVLDQTLKNDSYISLMNTNVIRAAEKDENFYTANVTGFEALVKTGNRLWSASAGASLSQKYYSEASTSLGHSLNFNAGKTGGKFRTDYNFSLLSDTYDPNDMGYLRHNNMTGHSLDFSYNTYEPFGNIMSTRNSIDLSYDQLFSPRAYTSASIDLGSMIILMNYWSVSLNTELTPWGENDYFEARTADMSMYYHRPPAIEASFRGDTDKSKRLYGELQVEYFRAWSDYDQHGYAWSFQPEFKASRRFSFDYAFGVEKMFNDIGFTRANQVNGIVFGKRDISTITNTLSGAFIFTASSYLTLRARHYWSRADYDGSYFELENDGSLNMLNNPDITDSDDVNTNFLNIDLVYTWRFAPGSELSLVWKNSIFSEGDIIIRNAMDNFTDLLSMPQTNSISLKILYYLDYQNFRKLFSSK